MKAIVVESPGGPEVLQIREVLTPEVKAGWVLIKIKAFGLNRAEMFTRQGHSGEAVKFSRVIGIECVGEIADASDSSLQPGQKVATMMGEMGRAYDGSYAEYTLVPTTQVIPVETSLSWEQFAAIPETFITAWGSLVESMAVQAGQTLLVRGGTSSVGMAATTIAKSMGLAVIATTRQEAKRQTLLDNGADDVIIDTGHIADEVKQVISGGPHAILELVGTVTLRDSLKAAAPKGIVCFTGILGNSWVLENFAPFDDIPRTVKLTTYETSHVDAAVATRPLQRALKLAEAGRYNINLDRVFKFDEIVEAHRYMEADKAKGKLVVVVD